MREFLWNFCSLFNHHFSLTSSRVPFLMCVCVRVHDRRSLSLFFFFAVVVIFFFSLLVGRARQTVASSSLSLCVSLDIYVLAKNIRLYFFCSLASFVSFLFFFCTLITDCDEMILSKTYRQRDEIKQTICMRKIQETFFENIFSSILENTIIESQIFIWEKIWNFLHVVFNK